MPTNVGPNTYGEENLVFGYDLGDVSNSYKGEPATNLITSGLPGYFGSGGETLYQERLYGLKSDSGVFQRNYVTNPALEDSSTYNNNAGLYKTFNTANLNPSTEYIQISFDFYMITPYVRINSSGTGLNGYLGVRSTDSTVDNYNWNTTYSNGSGDAWNNNSAYIGQWQKVSLIVDVRDDKVPEAITAMYIYNDRTLQGEGIFTNFIITEHVTFPTGPVRYTPGTRSATQGLLDLTGNSTIDLTNVSFDSSAQMTFDGTDDYIDGPALSTVSSEWTVEVVFKPSSVTNYENILDCNYAYNGTTGNIGPRLEMSNSGLLEWIWSGDTGNNNNFYRSAVKGSGLSANNWHYAAISRTAANTIIGICDNEVTTGVTTSGTPSAGFVNEFTNLNLGRGFHLGGADRIFTGDIAYVKVYNRALSRAELESNYRAVKGRFNI